MKLLKRVGAGLLAAACAFALCACNGGGDDKKPPEEEAASLHSPYNSIEGLEKDYVYMWYPNGLIDAEHPYINFQSERYAISFNSGTGKIEGLGTVNNTDEYFHEENFDQLPFLPTMYYDIQTANGHLRTDGTVKAAEDTNRLYARAIESGRNMQRLDIIAMNYQSIEGALIAKNFLGRLEIAAGREYFALNYGVYNSGLAAIAGATLSFSIDLGLSYSNVETVSSRQVKVTDDKGAGFTFVVPDSGLQSATIKAEGGVLTFTKTGIDLPLELAYSGFGVVVVPTTSAVSAEGVLAQESATISAVQKQPFDGRAQSATYDRDRGIFVINTDGMLSRTDPFTEDRLDAYEKLTFTITNPSDHAITVPVAFKKTAGSDFNAMGYVPMLRRTDGEQTGISVQISKNWHTYDGWDTAQYPPTHYKRYLEGCWSMCYATVEVPAGETIEYEYCVVFARWGGVYSISHSQLCLIGYASDWIWDQSCMGSWGESVCYDPDRCLGRSLIDDMRPFGMGTKAGAYNKYHWTDNVGGADFLWYYSLDGEGMLKEGRIIEQKVNYRSQGPNMSDVVYAGTTADGCVNSFINIRMGRTDDVIRCYYAVSYEIVSDLQVGDFALLKLGAEKYGTTSYKKYAVGNSEKVLRDDTFFGVSDTSPIEAEGDNLWMTHYDGTQDITCGNKTFIVREYRATVNGTEYNKPSYRLAQTSNGGVQPSFEISAPAAAGKILRAGSRFDLLVEMIILPNPSADSRAFYYGNSDYLTASQDKFNTAEAALQQAQGNELRVQVSAGKLQGSYPVEIETVSGDVAAQFTLKGGLGYTPVVFNGVPKNEGYTLQVKVGSDWQDVVQSGTKGETKDYWQVRRLYNGTYQWIFNVKNTQGLNFGTENEYRFVKK